MYVKTKKAHCKRKNLLIVLNRKTITKTITIIVKVFPSYYKFLFLK